MATNSTPLQVVYAPHVSAVTVDYLVLPASSPPFHAMIVLNDVKKENNVEEDSLSKREYNLRMKTDFFGMYHSFIKAKPIHAILVYML